MSLVGYRPDTLRSQLTTWDHSFAGGLSGSLGRAVLQPLDVAKIRLQLQVESSSGRKYAGLLNLMLTLPKEEGFKSLWKGHVPAQLLSVTYGLSCFLAFETSSRIIYESGNKWSHSNKLKPVAHFISGSIGGCAGTLISFPFDVIRTRVVAQPESNKIYKSTLHAARNLYTEGGIRAFYKGLTPTIAAIAPHTGLQFGFYSFFNQVLERLVTSHDETLGHEVMTILGSISCGGLAGMCAKISVYPMDVVKKRLQISGWTGRKGLGETITYNGAIHCIKDIAAREGMRGLYKGLSPALVKAAASSSLNFWLYEHICYILALRYSNTPSS